MAEKINYYGWLGLSAEKYESDPSVLSGIVEKKITEWSSHKSISYQNRAQIHGDKIRAAVQNPDEWKKIYLEYKDMVDEKLLSQFSFVANNMAIAQDDINKAASNNNVSTDYTKQLAVKNGYTIDGEKTNSQKKGGNTFKLDDIKPKSELKLKSIQDKILDLGAESLMDLLSKQDYGGNIITQSSSNDKVIEALEAVKKLWNNIPATGPKATPKSHIDKIYSGFMGFLKTASFDEYIQYLKYVEIKSVLNSIQTMVKDTAVSVLNEKAFNDYVNQLFELVEDRNKAKSILINFCDDKSIGYPVERPKLSVCPFCNNSFERTEPIQDNCPVCMKSFKVTCPKCRSIKHLLVDTECDGINLQIYPLLGKKMEAISESCERLNIEEARIRLNELNKLWPGYPGTSDAEAKIKTLEEKYSADINKIAAHCNKKEYFSAKVIIDRINGAFPDFKRSYGIVYSEIEAAENTFDEALKEPDISKRIALLLEINASVSDFSKLNTELKKYPIEPVSTFTADTDPVNGSITLNWKSANKPNSVFYMVRKKVGTPVSGIADGEELVTTQNCSYGDDNVEEGKAYYYAVYAYRGPIQSPLSVLSEPQILLKKPDIRIVPQNSSLDLSWNDSDNMLYVFYSDKPISSYDQGIRVNNISLSGVLIEGLSNSVPYYIAAYKAISFGGKNYRSPLFISTPVTPIEPIKPPVFSKSLGKKAGEYVLKNETSSGHNVELYYTKALAGISENSVMSATDMERKAKKLNAVQQSDGSFVIDMHGAKEMFIYPVINISNTLTVGNLVTLNYIEPISVKASISGSSLCLHLEKWPDKTNQIVICYNNDTFPQDITDCDRANKIPVSKALFDNTHMLEIPNVKLQDYYITLFARKVRENIPICTVYFSNRQTQTVRYSFGLAVLTGRVKITIKNEGSYRPKTVFAVGIGAVPLNPEKAAFTYEIPENTAAPALEVITVPKFTLKNNSFGKLFSSTPNCKMLVEGNTKLK